MHDNGNASFPTIYHKNKHCNSSLLHKVLLYTVVAHHTLSEGPTVAWNHRCWQAENGRHDIVQEAWNCLTHALLPDVAHGDHVVLHRLVATSKLKCLPLFVPSFLSLCQNLLSEITTFGLVMSVHLDMQYFYAFVSHMLLFLFIRTLNT